LKRVYHSALELAENERPAFLEKACAGDEALRQEVESLLRSAPSGDRFIEEPALKVAVFAQENSQSLLGQQLGSYKILSLLGAGGMGEVYRARDSKLNRDVALKVLPELFAEDASLMTRFHREARVLASLNHPNIAAIYGLEESNRVRALVMELVEGLTLADRIAQGPIPLDEVLPIARQMAEALEYAHEKGIIHRDLKPANVKLTTQGVVKVLDFGLAKAVEGDATIADLADSPTLPVVATESGVILGTAAYMAPEQARGKIVDQRADIWSFGAVLYEMLTRKRLYGGETQTRLHPGKMRVPSLRARRLEVQTSRGSRTEIRDLCFLRDHPQTP
jgi:eukaryotic-like serine/threonine-protein kinase